jgi:hypothetical protein
MTMIRPTDFMSSATFASDAVTPSWHIDTAGAAAASPWTQGESIDPMLRIGGDVSPAARGRSAAEHATQVLACLCVSAEL